MNLPTTQGEWEIANSFFHSELPISEVNKDNLNNVTENLIESFMITFTITTELQKRVSTRKTNYR